MPNSIVNIIVVGTYLNVGGGLPLDHRIKRIGPVNRIGKLLYMIMLLSFTTILYTYSKGRRGRNETFHPSINGIILGKKPWQK